MLMKLGGFKKNEYLIRHKLKDINTVGNNIMKLISLGLPQPTSPPPPPNSPNSGATMKLTDVCWLSHWLEFKCVFENHSTVGNQALADKVCYHTVFRSCTGQRFSLCSLSSRDLWNKLSFLSLEAGSSMGPFIPFKQKKGKTFCLTLSGSPVERGPLVNEQEQACDYMCSKGWQLKCV